MKRVKWFVRIVLIIAAVLSLSVIASAEDDYTYGVSDDGQWRCQITSENTVCLGSEMITFEAYLGDQTDVTVPKTLVYEGNTYSIVGINRYAFCDVSFIKSVTISEGVRTIQAYAFFNCPELRSVVLPESLELIEENALIDSEDIVYTVVKNSYAYDYVSSHNLNYKIMTSENTTGDGTGWKTADGKKYYINSEGVMVKNALVTIEGKKYYFGSDGAMYKSRLISVNCKKYYLGSDGAAYTKRLISLSGKKYYLGADAVAYKSRLISLDGKKYYLGSDCVAYKSKLASINGDKYYFGSDGIAYKSRLISVNNRKYYIGSDCKAYKSKFASLSGKKYYFGSDCIMRTGWRNIKDSNGVYHKYYFGTDGVMRKGWQKIKLSDGKTYTYYFKTSGIMVTGKVTIDGRTEYFQSNGRYAEPGSPLLRKVYIYPTGKKYHYSKTCCGTGYKQITLLEAKEMGLTPCKNCAGG